MLTATSRRQRTKCFPNIIFIFTEEQEESVYNLYISEVRNIRLRLESCEDRLIRQIRTPLERDDLHESVFRITEQEVRFVTILGHNGLKVNYCHNDIRCWLRWLLMGSALPTGHHVSSDYVSIAYREWEFSNSVLPLT